MHRTCSRRNDELDLNGVDNKADGIAKMNAWLEAHDAGTATINYKLRDWLFSRQRYWGEPFPIVYDVDGRPHSLPDDMLPVLLPETESFSPRTFDADDEFSNPESPLDRLGDWVEVELDLGDGPQVYRRDTNVMPQWAGSCWYEMRYLDPTNENRFVDREVEEYWMGPRTDIRPDHPGGVDLYVGGVEHAVLHLLYSRFWHKVLYDLGHVSSKEPYARLFNQGYVQAAAYKDEREIYVDATKIEGDDKVGFTYDGKPVTREWGKMGKSLKNAVSPDDMYEQYGADTLRLYEMATGPLDASRPWETRDVVGMYRFLQRLWRNMVDEETAECTVVDTPADDDTRKLLHRTIDTVRTEMDALRFNTAIAKLIELNNAVTKLDATPREVAEPMVIMLSPLVPHIAEELWRVARPRRHDHLRRVPRGRPGAAGRRHDRSAGADQRQGPWPHRRGRRRVAGRDRGDRARRRQDRRDRRRGDPEEGHRRPRPHGQHRRLSRSHHTPSPFS